MSDPSEAHCRVARVRMKGGGADLTVIRRGDVSDLAQKLMRHARQMGRETSPLSGFLLLTWDHEGAYQLSADGHAADDNPIPLSLLPGWVAEIIRRELVTERQIQIVLERDYDAPPPRSA